MFVQPLGEEVTNINWQVYEIVYFILKKDKEKKMVMKNKKSRDVTSRVQPNLENWTNKSSIVTSKWKKADCLHH